MITTDQPERVAALLAAHPVLDGHNDLPWALRRAGAGDLSALDIAEDCSAHLHTDLPRLAAGGVGGQFWSVFVPCSFTGGEAVRTVLEQVDLVHRMVRRYPDRLALATTADEVETAMASGRVASLLGAEGGHGIDCSLGVLRMLHRLGVRYLTLTHNENTPWADSATDESEHGGLTAFGREIVQEMNRIGMAVDLSHVSAETMRDALEVSAAPVMFSHSSARAVHNHPRNVPDDMLRSLAANGGVCMATFVPSFVTGSDAARLEDVVAHVEHLAEVAGVRHVGLGGDYDGTPRLPAGLEDVSGYPRLITALADRGWSDADLAAVTCRNVLRVLRAVEASADAPPRSPDPTKATTPQGG